MSFLKLVTIDQPDTRRREDGFHVDLSTKVISLASFVPDFSLADFEKVKHAFAVEPGGRTESFFPNSAVSERFGFTGHETHTGFIVSMAPPYDQAEVTLGTAKVDQCLTYDIAHGFMDINPMLHAVYYYVADEIGFPLSMSDMIRHLSYKLNSACTDAMKRAGVPRLGRRDDRSVVSDGLSWVSTPLRHPSAFINSLQLSSYLTTGKPHFTRKELADLLEESRRDYGG